MARRRDEIFQAISEETVKVFGEGLAGLAVFGSYGRGTERPDSDVDLLVIVRDLPAGRYGRWQQWEPVEWGVLARLGSAAPLVLSPVLKTPAELEIGSPLLLDLTEDAIILHDPVGLLAERLQRLRQRLQELGARRVWLDGDRWYWDLKPDYRPGEVFHL